MKKLTVTYKAPPGENKVVEAFGHTFFDGKPEEVTVDDDTAAKMQGNKQFQCSKPTDVDPSEGVDKEADKSAEKETKNENKAHGLPHR